MPTNILTNMRLYNKIIPNLAVALQNTYRRLYEEILIPAINERVYLAGTPEYYNRDHEGGKFFESFFYTTVQENFNSVSAMIGYDPGGEDSSGMPLEMQANKANNDWEPMAYDPAPPDEKDGKDSGFVHGSLYKSGDEMVLTDSRKNLADIIELGSPAVGGLFKGDGYWTEPRPFWDQFLTNVSMEIQDIFQQECQALGLNVRRKARFTGGNVSYERGDWKVSAGGGGGEDFEE